MQAPLSVPVRWSRTKCGCSAGRRVVAVILGIIDDFIALGAHRNERVNS
jgi:hypothetical protein